MFLCWLQNTGVKNFCTVQPSHLIGTVACSELFPPLTHRPFFLEHGEVCPARDLSADFCLFPVAVPEVQSDHNSLKWLNTGWSMTPSCLHKSDSWSLFLDTVFWVHFSLGKALKSWGSPATVEFCYNGYLFLLFPASMRLGKGQSWEGRDLG